MRILLDENTPPSLASLLTDHDVKHVDELGLKSLTNGELLAHARKEFECFVTTRVFSISIGTQDTP